MEGCEPRSYRVAAIRINARLTYFAPEILSAHTTPALISSMSLPFVIWMIHQTAIIVETIAVAGVASSIGYYALCLWSAASFIRERRDLQIDRQNGFAPPVSILKPLKGMDPQLYEALRSHCRQDYPEYEIIFGVSDANDPALALVCRLQQEFPHTTIQCIVCDKKLGANTKVSNLAQMLPAARYDYLIVNDGDICVPADYLQYVIPPLRDAKLGMVTCLYRGVAARTLGSRLESLGISTDFSAGVLVARYIERGLRFGLGSTLAFRRHDLQAIGGFESFVDYLADDYELARRIVERGFNVHLSELVVDTFLPAYSIRQFMDHQLRWLRGVRDCRPGGYAGLIFTFGIPWALLALAVSSASPWGWGLLAVTVGLRLAVVLEIAAIVLRDPQVFRLLWLIPLRDVVALWLWIASFTGRTVSWRGDTFYLKDGKLARISP
jgi:ceramide glucosyltransferase